MTPFGEQVRALRRERGMTQAEMAAAIGVSNAYLSALEHGRRGKPTFDLVHRIIGCLGVIWDDAEELLRLADRSHPKITIDTGGLDPDATHLANRLAETIGYLAADDRRDILAIVERAEGRAKGGRPVTNSQGERRSDRT
ncbi:helix-turn-helix transcriptional regulator [Fulvimarina sp. 2208YS6-2-32]|uniref:Helix-turn-helix transcriptional regulator n=1 Tax=Fulvimarina uroteuthidis TaxID=3098149 RepID=A0ABU5I0Q2_9HYPH|nr:helix-turn-helix transcriptional regulator [Fulvimarina sp. 2208YS6-2-32]MDY8108976.1 helix-turn-helix transcriptional regulator [Fulvimarina sp. 2208YS6-2-32]